MDNRDLIGKLKEGADIWNEWRKQNPELVVDLGEGVRLLDINLKGVNLSNANLKKAKLSNANLEGAKLINSDLEDAKLDSANLKKAALLNVRLNKADLIDANLKGSDLSKANLEGANLFHANLEGSILVDANLKGAILNSVNLKGADLFKANLQGARFTNANLEDADLRKAQGLLLDSTFTRNARFSLHAEDPWSILRRKYTGPRLTFNLLFLIAFILPYIGKIAFWSFINRGQGYTQGLLEAIRQRAADQGIDDQTITVLGLSSEKIKSLSQCLREDCQEPHAVWELLLGTDQSALFWLIPFWVLPLALIVYNALSGFLTYRVAPMRDEEERSNYSPDWIRRDLEGKEPKFYQFYRKSWWHGYRCYYLLHTWIVAPLFYISVLAFLFNARHWLGQPIYLPI